jgi:hypothetical protein
MPNFNEKTGIRYGVISPHSIGSWSLNDIYDQGTDPIYESGKNDILNDIKALCEEYNLDYERINTDSFIDEYSDNYQGNDSGIMDYSDSEYDLHISGDNFGIFVMRSPYYTYCRNCSPCAPGAGDLDNPIDVDGGVPRNEPSPVHLAFKSCCTEKTYCLGPEWFDKEDDQYSRKIPYRVFRVDNDQEVI